MLYCVMPAGFMAFEGNVASWISGTVLALLI